MTKRAGVVSTETKARILNAAKAEFSSYGFSGSSLRRICAAADVTTGAIYFFFESKEDLFTAVISRITGPLMKRMEQHYAAERDYIRSNPIEGIKDNFETVDILIRSYYSDSRTWKILLAHQAHPAVQAVIHRFQEEAADHYLYLLDAARRAGRPCNPVDRFSLLQYVRMQLHTIVSLFSQDFSREEMTVHLQTAVRMLRGAFYALLED